MKVRVEKGDGCRDEFWIFKLSDSLLKLDDRFAQDLRPRLALSIVVLAAICLLGASTLLAGRLCTVAAHLTLSAAETSLAPLEGGLGARLESRRLVSH